MVVVEGFFHLLHELLPIFPLLGFDQLIANPPLSQELIPVRLCAVPQVNGVSLPAVGNRQLDFVVESTATELSAHRNRAHRILHGLHGSTDEVFYSQADTSSNTFTGCSLLRAQPKAGEGFTQTRLVSGPLLLGSFDVPLAG